MFPKDVLSFYVVLLEKGAEQSRLPRRRELKTCGLDPIITLHVRPSRVIFRTCSYSSKESPTSHHVLGAAARRDVEDAVLADIAFCRLPAHLEGAGGGVRDLQVPHSAQSLCQK